jgi:nucleotidyltransferase/DNA polymerase involved in DNA repair
MKDNEIIEVFKKITPLVEKYSMDVTAFNLYIITGRNSKFVINIDRIKDITLVPQVNKDIYEEIYIIGDTFKIHLSLDHIEYYEI